MNKKPKSNFLVKVVGILFLIFMLFVLLIPIIMPIDLGKIDLSSRLINPSFFDESSNYLFGTDQLGRDVFIRLFYATRTTILISFLGMLGASVFGIILGLLSGYYGGTVDRMISLVTEAFMTVPTTFIGIVVSTILGAGPYITVLVILLSGWATFTRITRGQVKEIKNESFIESSKVVGLNDFRIIVSHVIPNIASTLIIHMTTSLSGFILLESTLSFLGLGIQPPGTSLGVMVSEGRDFMLTHWWLVIAPSVVMVFIIFSISIIGDWLRDYLDPKLRNFL